MSRKEGAVEEVGDGWITARYSKGVTGTGPYDAFEHADPSVPDVDGNPIRVGQLVERMGSFAGEGSPPVGWVTSIEGGAITVDDGVFTGSRGWRVVTETFRPPEPATRTVVLQVTLEADAALSGDTVREDVREALYQHGRECVDWPGMTVKVVDYGADR